MLSNQTSRIAVVIPSYKVRNQILCVISRIGPEVSNIFVIDDSCPEGSGHIVEELCTDKRVTVLYNNVNLGVGGAVIAGYKAALDADCTILVKIDGDGQMDPTLLNRFVSPIFNNQADYTKGNRFFLPRAVGAMPSIRKFGNIILSFFTKLSTGYWDLFDPTNGYTAIHASIARCILEEKISERYFFETDVLFKLSRIRAVVKDIPMYAVYGDEVSNLRVSRILLVFLLHHIRQFFKRVFYQYYIHNFTIGSIYFPVGFSLLACGVLFGIHEWDRAITKGVPATAGTVMLAAIPLILGVQFILAFLNEDISSVPKQVIHTSLD